MAKILVVDDDLEQRDLYLQLFRDADFEVDAASDGQEAWEKIHKSPPDLVFTGIIMPRMTGFQLIDKLRSNQTTVLMPVIMFSHLGRDEDRKKAANLSGVEFMIKGYDGPGKILKTAKELISPQNAPNPKFNPDEDIRIPRTMI